jgi:tetraacyldisaccharide-1-P 4'-kinase
VAAACAVARPEVFFGELEAAGLHLVERVALSDHAVFPTRLRERMSVGNRPWLVTAKDSARGNLPSRARPVGRILEPTSACEKAVDDLVNLLPASSDQSGVLESAPSISRTSRGTR